MAKKNIAKGPNIFQRAFGALENSNFLFILGLIVATVTIYLTCSLLSFFFSGGADQSLYPIDTVADVAESVDGAVENSTGLGGAVVANYLVNTCFGWSVLFFIPFLVALALRLMDIKALRLTRWFICSVFGVVWGSLFSAFTFGEFMAHSFISPGGMHGKNVVEWLMNNIGGVGISLLLLITLLLFMIYLTSKTIVWLKSLFTLSFVKKNNSDDVPDNSDEAENLEDASSNEYIEEPAEEERFVVDLSVDDEQNHLPEEIDEIDDEELEEYAPAELDAEYEAEVEYVILDEALLAEGIQEDPVDVALNEVFYVVIAEHNSITGEVLDGNMEEYEKQLLEELNFAIKDWGLQAKSFKLLSIVPRKK